VRWLKTTSKGGYVMDREIKFRAWVESNKAMCKVEKILSFENDMHFILDDDTSDLGNHYGASLLWAELMQYTGLKDKNGKEIYEGDIIEFKVGNDVRVRDSVSFRGGSFILTKRVELLRTQIVPHKEPIVIGNIYENSDLLEQN
jgi:uncharacterized phage protein (TIGR01671 family)